ncbi:MAG TPA: UPF0182 family protein [Bacillota bacterium]|jgi:hypothetical protein|nr:UPF0182 family protein [Bacillota bacterium]HNY67626.1 UPF0182 family protein [Bacillota bacterium]
MSRVSGWVKALIVVLIGLALAWNTLAVIVTEHLWYADLGYLGVFWKRAEARVIVCVAAFAVTFAFVAINLLATKAASRLVSTRAAFIIAAASGLAVAAASYGSWMEFQQFIHATSFGKPDPIFGRDISFYVFRLPIIRRIYAGSRWVVGLTAASVILIYLVSGALVRFGREEADLGAPSGAAFGRRKRGRIVLEPIDARAKLHVCVLFGAGLCIVALGFALSMWGLVYSTRGVVLGASYADVHGTLPGLRLLIWLMLASAVFIVGTGLRAASTRTWVVVCITAVVLLGVSFFAIDVYPGIIQKLYVTPNELVAESEYIGYNIDFTRSAFGLDRVEEKEYAVTEGITAAKLEGAEDTLANVRLWDWEPLLSTFEQLQEMRLYYHFADIDIGRYTIDGKTTQVMLSAREMDVSRLPSQAQTWVNTRLKYTHGYGACASPVNEIGQDGLPMFLVGDIPPRYPADMRLDRPEIYFGELTGDWVIVNTRAEEFDYPLGDSNEYTKYDADSGIRMGYLFRRLLFSTRFNDSKVIFSRDITPDSRMLFARDIRERVRRIAPFLQYDGDPYAFIADGRLMWLIDGMTTSTAYPYAERFGDQLNYIRNSVKVSIDAYTGEVKFYLIDPDDPIAATYAKVFPGLFRPASEMPESIRQHLRYPEDLFKIQTRMYAMYHMTDPEVFYNKEDLWGLPREIYKGQQQQVSPYYVNMQLPGESGVSFVLFTPFTPSRKDNMVAWLAVSSDADEYGRMVAVNFGKQRVVFGPMQIEAQIDQDAEISKMLSLWNQSGSTVIRGNLLVYPINGSILYVEPLFLAAQASQLPQLKRVIVSDGTRVEIGSDLPEALEALVGRRNTTGASAKTGTSDHLGEAVDRQAGPSAREALDLYQKAQERLRAGDLAGYDRIQKQLEQALKSMASEEE